MHAQRMFFFFFLNGRNLLAVPALSATAEQSFRATRRRKTWLRRSVDELALITLLFYMRTRPSTLTVQSKAAICWKQLSALSSFWNHLSCDLYDKSCGILFVSNSSELPCIWEGRRTVQKWIGFLYRAHIRGKTVISF